ncbi:type II secretion system secretin GspD [bacterium]|nr:type II secretion system secretin GspD [candidate division CSSED10-310 bacterium]
MFSSRLIILTAFIVALGGCAWLSGGPDSRTYDQPAVSTPDVSGSSDTGVSPENAQPDATATPTPYPPFTPVLTSGSSEAAEEVPTATPTQPPTFTDEDMEQVQMNFEDASLREILVFLAEMAGWDYLISPEVGNGTVTLRTTKPFRKADVEKVLYSILDMNNLAVTDGPTTIDGQPAFKKIIPKPDAKHSPVQTRFGRDISGIPQEDVLVTQIIVTQFVSPDEILNIIRPLISPDATIITHPGANMMIITETSSNIRRLLGIIELLDQETALMELEIFQIKFADVQDIVSVLERVISSKVSLGSKSAAPQQSRNPRSKTPVTQATSGGGDMSAILIPDPRSNSLIVFALRKDLEFIREIISILDVDIYITKKAYIYYVENSIASDLAGLLEAVFSGKDTGGSTVRRTTSSRTTQQSQALGGNTIGSAADIQGEVSIVADERTNSLIIVTAPVNYPYIESTIKKLDIMPKQVLIEVLIVDVTLDESSELGVSWSMATEGSLDIGGETRYFESTVQQTVGGPGVGFVYDLFEVDRFRAIISAKANENKLEVLASPHILVANNQQATIDVGSDIPVVTNETDEGYDAAGNKRYNRTIEYRKTGTLLTVTPHINSAQFVNMELQQEVSNLSEKALEGISSPIIETRKATTSVMIGDGQTLVIGGLIQRTRNPSSEGVPWFYRIPLLKYLFGKHKYTERASELLIFLTPQVIDSPEEAQSVSDKVKSKINIDRNFYESFIGLDQTQGVSIE